MPIQFRDEPVNMEPGKKKGETKAGAVEVGGGVEGGLNKALNAAITACLRSLVLSPDGSIACCLVRRSFLKCFYRPKMVCAGFVQDLGATA